MRPGSRTWIGARLVVAGFCWVTALYGFITSSAFAYQQFIRPRVFHWIGIFSTWHAAAAWLVLAIAAATLRHDLSGRPLAKVLSLGFLAASTVGLILNSLHPILPVLTNGDRAVAVGIVGLLPVVWLGLIDHAEAGRFIGSQSTPSEEVEQRGIEGRLFLACAATAIYVLALYTILTSIALAFAFEPDLLTTGQAIAAGQSLVEHLVIFLAAFLTVATITRLTRGHFVLQYTSLTVALVAMFALLFLNVIANTIGLSGTWALAAAFATSASIVLAWGGLHVRRLDALDRPVRSAVDIFLAPYDARDSAAGMLRLASMIPLAFVLAAAAGRLDWDFVVLKCGVLLVWIFTLAAVYRVTPLRPRLSTATIAVICLVPLTLDVSLRPGAAERHLLDRYAVHNPSFRVADLALSSPRESRSFDQYLKANTGFTDVDIKPVSIDFVTPLTPVPAAKRPLIFLLVIDSLRADYLAPYNHAVTFTPRITEFAAQNIVLGNTFTAYGGTGVSVPAIWAGSDVAHKQYVHPFAPMNALDKLLNVNGYRRLLSLDHITAELLEGEPVDELDRGRDEMQFDFCGTLEEMAKRLSNGEDDAVFGHTRSLNLHVALVRNGAVPAGETYPGFNDSYAWRVHRMDGCFGAFIDALKRRGLYDRSIVILTADHGEHLGEDGKWGHSYYMTPQIIQVPLLVHMPAGAPHEVPDPEAISFTTDITPTIYAGLGYQPAPSNDLMGMSLVQPSEEDAFEARRRGTFVLAASYGAVYAVVRHNGHRLYIADAINGTERAYDRAVDGRWTDRQMTEGIRMINQLAIRHHLDELANLYHLE